MGASQEPLLSNDGFLVPTCHAGFLGDIKVKGFCSCVLSVAKSGDLSIFELPLPTCYNAPTNHIFMYTGPLYIASDHGGHKLKKRLVRYIQNELERDVIDLGADTFDDMDDFPVYILPAAEKAVETNGRAILLGGSGTGEMIAANKVKGMRCALCHSVETAELARKDNDANGLAMGGRILTEDHAMAILKAWLTTEFKGGKYQKRNDMIAKYEADGTLPTKED